MLDHVHVNCILILLGSAVAFIYACDLEFVFLRMCEEKKKYSKNFKVC